MHEVAGSSPAGCTDKRRSHIDLRRFFVFWFYGESRHWDAPQSLVQRLLLGHYCSFSSLGSQGPRAVKIFRLGLRSELVCPR